MKRKIRIFALAFALCALLAPGANAAAALPADTIIDSDELRADTAIADANHPHRILLWGDSMAGVLNDSFRDYAEENGYEVSTVTWISATLKLWAETDRLEGYLRQFKPEFIVVVLGSNDLFATNLTTQARYLETILNKMGDIPYVWIGPPNWKPDKGIDSLICTTVGEERYFDSAHLHIARRTDGIHPSNDGAKYWMERIAPWLSSRARPLPLRMAAPTKTATNRRTDYVYLKPYRAAKATAKRTTAKKKTTTTKRTAAKRSTAKRTTRRR